MSSFWTVVFCDILKFITNILSVSQIGSCYFATDTNCVVKPPEYHDIASADSFDDMKNNCDNWFVLNQQATGDKNLADP